MLVLNGLSSLTNQLSTYAVWSYAVFDKKDNTNQLKLSWDIHKN